MAPRPKRPDSMFLKSSPRSWDVKSPDTVGDLPLVFWMEGVMNTNRLLRDLSKQKSHELLKESPLATHRTNNEKS